MCLRIIYEEVKSNTEAELKKKSVAYKKACNSLKFA